jgi:hypothetical protein
MTNCQKWRIATIVTSALAVCYAGYVHLKVNKTNRIINASIDDISKDIAVDISDEIVDKAVTKAVNREVDKVVTRVSRGVTTYIQHDIHNQVKDSINESYSNIRESVSSEVARKVANLDMEVLKREVKEKARQLVVEKFNENLDSLLQDFNNNLTNVSKIYSSIADNMKAQKPTETVFKIGG